MCALSSPRDLDSWSRILPWTYQLGQMDNFQTSKVERLRRRFKGWRDRARALSYTLLSVSDYVHGLDWTRAGALSELIILSSVIEPDHASFVFLCVFCYAPSYMGYAVSWTSESCHGCWGRRGPCVKARCFAHASRAPNCPGKVCEKVGKSISDVESYRWI